MPGKVSLKNPRQLSPLLLAEQHQLDAFLTADPIPGPKPWSDEFERAAIAGCAYACPPQVSLRSLGLPASTASLYLSDEPPKACRSACFALRERLNKATAWCEKSLLSRIARAGEEPTRWQANAWVLERSKLFSQQYVAAVDSSALGPSTVVNIGQVNITAGPVAPSREPIIEAEAIRPELPENLAESLVVA
jgi:hypothetical protein